jgi:phenylpyruvate tautomerase PptA (4-oxalocrotonate tautomerase family)
MPFVEVFVPKGSLSSPQREALQSRLVAEVMQVEGAPDTPQARAISWLVLHEVDDGEAPRYVVRIAVPAGSLDYFKREEMMRRVNDLLAEIDQNPERLRRVPEAWVHINEVPEGNWGAFGRVVPFRDIAAHVAGLDVA